MMMWGQICNVIHGLKPALMMVLVQVGLAGGTIMYKLAANDGMSVPVFSAYRLIFAAAFMVPLALIVERKSRPNLNLLILFQAFLCGLFGGALFINLFSESLVFTSATFVAAMANLIPATTFLLSICTGLEKLAISTRAGKAKLVGTFIGIGGAMLLTFYKGAEINIWSTNVDLIKSGGGHLASLHADPRTFLLGALLALIGCFCFTIWLVVQAKMSIKYPCPYSSTALMSVMATIQSVVFALCVEKDWNQWRLGWNIRLLAVAYSGIVASGLMGVLITWCVRMRGPLFTSIFSPLELLVVAFLGSLLLDEKLHLGSILGGILIVVGLYAVLWGKGKEMKKKTQLAPANKISEESETIEVVTTTTTMAEGDLRIVNKNEEKIKVDGGDNILLANEEDNNKREVKGFDGVDDSDDITTTTSEIQEIHQ